MKDKKKAEKYFNEGIKFFQNNNFKLAQEHFENANNNFPNNKTILKNLALSFYHDNDFINAKKKLKEIINLEGEKKEAFSLLIKIFTDEENFIELKKIIDLGLKEKQIDIKYKIVKELIYPTFYEDKNIIKKLRNNYEISLDRVEKLSENFTLDIEKQIIDPPIFKLSYDEFDNLKINKKIVKIFRKIYPSLNKDIKIKKTQSKKFKIAFISEYFTNHTIMKLFEGIITKIDKNNFEIFVIHSHKTEKSSHNSKIFEAEINNKIKNIFLPKSFEQKVNIIKEIGLDILFYTDIHMSVEMYYLTYLKLAKIQMTTWGHPETTGNDKIDFFLSSKLLEVEDAQKHYTEKLLLSDDLPMYYFKPLLNDDLNKEDLTRNNVYFCPQTLFKIHPSFDEIVKKILINDKKAKILFINDEKKILSKKLFNRFKKSISIGLDRISFIERIKKESDFIKHCGTASVLLDPLIFGAGNSFYESMFYGTPTVSMPTKYLKGRVVQGAYKQMKIDEPPIVNTIEKYVDKSIEIANLSSNISYEYKKHMKEQAEKYLYENINFVKQLEKIFFKIINNFIEK